MNITRRLRSMLVICLLMVVACSAVSSQTPSRNSERKITKVTEDNEPLEVADIHAKNIPANNKSVRFGVPFAADDTWLQGLKVKLKNISDQPIVYANVSLEIPKSGTMQHPYLVVLTYGHIPPMPGEIQDDYNFSPVMRGNSLDLTVSDASHTRLKEFLKSNAVKKVDSVQIHIGLVVFADGTGWLNGYVMHRDPLDPGGWNVIRRSTAFGSIGLWRTGAPFQFSRFSFLKANYAKSASPY